jgi:hypothetical protein
MHENLSMLGLLPPWFWEKIGDASKTKDRLGLRIYYDQDCGFCARSVGLIKTFFLLPKVELFPSTIDASIERDMSLHNSWVLLDAKENRYFGFRGVIAALERSPLFLASSFNAKARLDGRDRGASLFLGSDSPASDMRFTYVFGPNRSENVSH